MTQFEPYLILRSLLFKLAPETAHFLALKVLQYAPHACFKAPVSAPIKAMGLNFPNAVGLAAGFDKNGAYLKALTKLGFGFIEVGTVTPKPQLGNVKPRLFRLPEAHALINRMGFNNEGVQVLVAKVKAAGYTGILGINIGKNKDTPLNAAVEDYRYCMQRVYPYASYITLNISSPNTPDLRQLQQGDYLSDLISRLVEEKNRLEEQYKRQVPLVVKVSPDESEEILKNMAAVFLQNKIDGIIASNTTCGREGLAGMTYAKESGGLSGTPLREKALGCLRVLKKEVGDEITLVGSGGIDSLEAAKERYAAGASLIQLYTGLIYEGPGLIAKVASL